MVAFCQICEDIEYLRHNQNFDTLDQFASENPPQDDDTKPPNTPRPNTIAPSDTLAPLDPLEEPLKPGERGANGEVGAGKTPTYIASKNGWMFGIQQALEAVQQIMTGFYGTECPAEPLIGTACASVKTAGFIIALGAVAAAKRIYDYAEFRYIQDDTISDSQVAEMYENTRKTFTNQKILHQGLIDLGTLNSDVQARTNGQLATLQAGVNTAVANTNSILNNIETHNSNLRQGLDYNFTAVTNGLATTLTNTESLLSDVQQLLQEVGRTSAPTADPAARRLLEEDHAADMPTRISCGFDVPNTSEDKKTLFISEGRRKKEDTGVHLKLENSCTKGLKVDVSVYSNELEESTSALVAASTDIQRGIQTPKIHLSPNICQGDDFSCVSTGSTNKRIYTIHVRAANELGTMDEDMCRVVVAPEAGDSRNESRELRGQQASHHMPRDEIEDPTLEDFEVGRLSLLRMSAC
ncbi:expressed unknown protein [Seminavis robusta]|uniref:Uncharacterized protein n=1 Tax=Seminavis robusta TaxID=568900 RepID=A0A9N8HDU3_9STRA|nr:expressed unknown protein [Seminavis robusta]|eukprot:Sro357_g125720.1 n/a (467) ;mRNA; r:55973-58106